MTALTVFPDVEVVLMDGLEAGFVALEPGDVGTVTPSNLHTRMAQGRYFVRVGRVAGRDDRISDYAVIDVDVFAPTRDGARSLAESIRAWLLGYPVSVGAVTLDRVSTETAPFRAPWEDEAVWRFLATYQITTRR